DKINPMNCVVSRKKYFIYIPYIFVNELCYIISFM
ncbi:MAG: hypothetical protein ACI9NY_001870, partial [Kiritimatiellia bacterium]